jgi:hypothetical protein
MSNLTRWLLQYSDSVEECLQEDQRSADGFKIQDGEFKAIKVSI